MSLNHACSSSPPDWGQALRQGASGASATPRWVALGVLGLHLAGLWALLQVPAVRQVVHPALPMVFSLVPARPEAAPPTPPLSPPAPAAAKPLRTDQTLPRSAAAVVATPRPGPVPAVVVAKATPGLPNQAMAPVEPEQPLAKPAPAAAAPAPAAAPVAPPAAPPPPAPASPVPKLLPPTAVRYLVPPAVEVPLASRRLGESGTVLLRVLVGADGRPRKVQVHQGSGFARLDEQALAAMAKAHFQPQTDNGQPVEWVVIAPLAYELD